MKGKEKERRNHRQTSVTPDRKSWKSVIQHPPLTIIPIPLSQIPYHHVLVTVARVDEGFPGAATVTVFCGAVVVICEAAAAAVVEETGVQTCSVGVVEAGVGGVKTGVVTVHWAQVVTVSVVRKVEVVVMISTEVLPPLWWVVVETGQLVTVV